MVDAHTRLYGVIGNPVRHSLSPVIHNGAFQRMGLNALYLAFEVHRLDEAIRGIRGLGIRGVSVTTPFKTRIIPFLDQLEDIAEKIKAVNTVSLEEGRLIGYNTDGCGALNALEEEVDLSGKRILLLGCGGAARAIAFGLKEQGTQVTIANRTSDHARALAEELGLDYLPLSSLGKLEAQVVINATSLGMPPLEEQTPFPKELLQPGMTVMDIVYKPLQTKLLREASEKGCQVIDGLAMLAHQGAAQCQIWTGKKPEIEAIKKDPRRELAKPGGDPHD